MQHTIHQIFFRFNGNEFRDYPVFVASHNAFKRMRGWRYKLWNEQDVEQLCRAQYPGLLETYRGLKYDIQRVDIAKYLIADSLGGVVVDLDVMPLTHISNIVADRPYVFDRCSRKGVVANDFFYVAPGQGLPGLVDYFKANLERVGAIPVYEQRKMRYVFHTTGPDFFTRYLKRAGLREYVQALSNRSFLDQRQSHRHIRSPAPKLDIVHHLSWVPQLHTAGRDCSRTA